MDWEGLDWISLVPDKDSRQAAVNMAMNFWVSKLAGGFLADWRNIKFFKRTPL